MQSQRDIEHLTRALAHPDADIRRRAVMALRSLDAAQAVPALKAALERETDPQVRISLQVAIHALAPNTIPVAPEAVRDVQSLVRILQGRSPEQAIAAARTLGELGDRLAVEPLVILFHNSAAAPTVRLAAAEALLVLKSAPAVVTLLGALRRDSWEVRLNAAVVLGQIQAAWAVDPLAAALDDENPMVRRSAAAALHRIGTVEAVTALRKRYGGQPAPVNMLAASAPAESPSPAKAVEAPTARRTDTPTASSPAPARPAPAASAPVAPTPAALAAPAAVSTAKPDQPKPLQAAANAPKKQAAPEQVRVNLTSMPTRPHAPAKPAQSKPVKSPVVPPPSPVPERAERPTLLTRPVNRLIAFFKSRDGS